jgi:transglutaminase-like putative cysteine protease
MRARSFCFLFAVVLAVPASAQAPAITSAGDPSIRSDTIYKLAVNPSAYTDDAAVLLLDDGVVRYEMDGTGSETYRQVTQILAADAVADYAEHEFAYSPGHQKLTVNWIRVLRPDGTVISEAPAQAQDADVPASMADPVYSDTKIRRYSLSGVAPGTIVDWSYTLQEVTPFFPGDFLQTWSIQNSAFTRRSRFLVDLPAAMHAHLVERNLTFRRRETTSHGRRTYLWTAQDVPPIEPEEFMADSDGTTMSVGISAPIEWEDVGTWYTALARDRYTLNQTVRERVRSLVRTAATPDDSLQAIQRWVAQDIRYVSIALGLGGYQPRMPAEVVRTGYGDCKDKATLFIAAARALGFRAYPVLLNAGEQVDRELPSIRQFDHAIAVVERPAGRVYLDLTADLAPYGDLPESDQGRFGLIVYPDGTSEQVTLPETPAGENLNQTVIIGALSSDGYVTATYQERGSGSRQYGLRSLFVGPIDSLKRADFARSIATKLFPGASADSLQIFDGRDLTAEPRVALQIVHGLAARSSGGTVILTLPFPSMRAMADAATMLEARQPRRFPIDAAKVIGPVTTETELKLTLPAGWRVRLPPSVDVSGKWGNYQAHYQQNGDTLAVHRRLEGARGVYPPASLSDLAAWLRAVAQDDVSYLVIEPSVTP